MTEEDWLDGLRHLSHDQILQSHFSLQEQIKKHYKLRSDSKQLKKAIALCEQQIALAPMAILALEKAHDIRVAEYEKYIGKKHPDPKFRPPSHHGYYQYGVILRRYKEFDKLEEIERKKISEGWA